MKAMLLAAGRGERMRPLTDNTPKPLLQVNGISLIDYHLHKLRKANVTDVVINTCWLAEKLTAHVGDGSRYDLTVQYSHEPLALETAGGVAQALPMLGREPFMLISADIWCDVDFTAFSLTAMSAQTAASLLLVDNPQHNTSGDFSLSGQRVCRYKKHNSLTYAGIGLFTPQLFAEVQGRKTPLRDVLYPAIDNGRVDGIKYKGQWTDVGTVERLTDLNKQLGAD